MAAFQLAYQLFLAAELIPAVDEGHVRTGGGKKQRVLQSGVSAAHHGHPATVIKGAVAHGAVAHATAHQLLFALQAQMAVSDAGCKDDGPAGMFAILGGDGKAAVFAGEGGDSLHLHVYILGEHLLHQSVCQKVSGHVGDAGVVFYPGGKGDLSAKTSLFQNQHGLAGPGGIEGSGQACGAAADDDDIMHRKHLSIRMGKIGEKAAPAWGRLYCT